MSDPSENVTPRLDAAERLERVIDAQSTTLERIDDKSGRVARLLGILLGVVLSSVSLSAQITGVTFESLSTPTRLSFLAGIGFLLVSLVGASVTLLSTRYETGLGYATGMLLSRTDYEISSERHLRRVLGTYAHSVRTNRRIIAVNARRFRRALLSLLLGLLYAGLAPTFLVAGTSGIVAWAVLGLSIPVATGAGWFVLSDRYLPVEPEVITNE